MQDVTYKLGPTLYCEVSGAKARPLLPFKFRKQVMLALHNGLDHCGQKEFLRRISSEYYRPSMRADISEYSKACHPCQVAKTGKPIKMPNAQIHSTRG